MRSSLELSVTLVFLFVLVGLGAPAAAYDSGNVLENGDFEKGDLSEPANDVMGVLPWLTSNTENAIEASDDEAHGGKYSLAWKQIGWNIKDTGELEDAGLFMLNNCREHIEAGAREVRISGYALTEGLAEPHALQVILANGAFTAFNVDTSVAGGVEGWTAFEAAMPLSASDKSAVVAFNITDTKGAGAPGSVVYLDDLSLSYRVKADAVPEAAPEAQPEPESPSAPVPVSALPDGQTRPFLMGFTPFAWDLGDEVAERSLRFVTTHGEILCHHFDGGVPWTEALAEEPFAKEFEEDWARRKAGTPEGTKVYVALTPFNNIRNDMALYRGASENLPIPEPFKGKRFTDDVIKKAYLNYCRRAVEHFSPDYLAIGIEVNEFLHNDPGAWEDSVELYKHTYAALKEDYPDLPIFASLTLHNLLKEEWEGIEEQRKQIQDFLKFNDLAGVSFYSFFNCLGPAARPMESFDWIREFVGDLPLALCETTYPAEETHVRFGTEAFVLPGNPEDQRSYYETLFEAATRDDYLFVVNFLYRDYDRLWEKIKDTTPEWAMGWKDTGLLDGDGESRPAWHVWEQYRALPIQRKEGAK